MHIDAHQVIDRPVPDVFRFVAVEHFRNHPKWDPDIVEIIPATAGPIDVGARCRVVRRQGAGTLEVREFEPERRLTTYAVIGPFRLTMECGFTAEGAGRTRLELHSTVECRGPMRLLMPLMRPGWQRNMARSLGTIRQLLEGGGQGGEGR